MGAVLLGSHACQLLKGLDKEGTVYEHLKRVIDFSMNHLGPHGMPAEVLKDRSEIELIMS